MILLILISLELFLISVMTSRLESEVSLSEEDRSLAKDGMGRLRVILIVLGIYVVIPYLL